jgi:DNA-binding NarL/FixJ family response regulator
LTASAHSRREDVTGPCHDERVTRVLIVDDHPSFRANVRLLLEAEGFEVVGEAGDAARALEQAAALAPDVVLLDVQLADADGFAVARRICAGDPAPRVVLVSSRDESDYGALVCDCGAAGFIAKGDLSGGALAALLS